MKQLKETVKLKRWQLLRYRSAIEQADLSGKEIVAVGKKAFMGNRYLEEVLLPSMTSAIKSEAFADRKRLKYVMLPEDCGVGVSLKAFSKCNRLKRVTNSESITSIGARAFFNCESLEEMTFGKDLRRIGAEAFSGCRSLQALHIPASVQAIGEQAFANCTELARLEIENGIDTLSKSAFQGCISLQELTLSETLTAIPASAFEGCSALPQLTIPGCVKKIGNYAFFSCRRLKEVTLEPGVQVIGSHAFDGTPRLERVCVPSSVRRIGRAAFGTGRCKQEEQLIIEVETEYMVRRLKRLLFFAGSLGCVRVVMAGQTIEERKRARRRTELEQKPVHLTEESPYDNILSTSAPTPTKDESAAIEEIPESNLQNAEETAKEPVEEPAEGLEASTAGQRLAEPAEKSVTTCEAVAEPLTGESVNVPAALANEGAEPPIEEVPEEAVEEPAYTQEAQETRSPKKGRGKKK